MFHTLRCAVVLLPIIGLWSCGAMSQPAPTQSPQSSNAVEGRALAEKFIRPNNGTAAIVFNEKGDAIVVNKEGQVVQPCQVCTPELERRYGPQCSKAPKTTEMSTATDKQTPAICNKLVGTTVQGVKPISVLRHTGSECMTFFFNNDGIFTAYEYCW